MTFRLANQIFAFFFLVGSSLSAQEAGDDFKAAGVDVQKVFRSYYKTGFTQRKIDQERARIQKEDNQARAQIAEVEKRLQAILVQLREETLSDDERVKLGKEREILTQQVQKFDEARGQRYQRANDNLDNEMQGKMRALLEEIRSLVNEHAKTEGFAIVFDRSGTNTNQVSPIIYGSELVDITAVLMKELNKDAPEGK
ncbi:MAG: OmpH family outer membrane protein [Verrucomicrobiaceae bacterium]